MNNKAKEKKMKYTAKHALKPKLRFPGFRDAGEWHAKELKYLIEVVTPPKKIPITQYSATGSYPIIDQSQKYISGWTDDEYAVISHELPLIVFGDHTCVLKITDTPFAQGADGIKIFHASSGVTTRYLYQYLLFNPVKMEEYKRHFSILKRKTVVFPEKKSGEQQIIAECLFSIDEVLAGQAQKLAVLKAHKIGLMQQLFPAEGETLPRLRFSEFRNAGKWVRKDLGPKTIKVGSGITPRGGEKTYKEAGRPFIRSQNIGWGELLLNDVAFIDDETHETFISTEISELDVLLNITGASIGRSAIANSKIAGGNVNQHVCIIRTGEELNPAFLNQFLLSQYGQNQIDRFQAGGNRQGLNFAQVRSFSIPIPPTPDEQKMVADSLSSLHQLIIAKTQQLEILKAHKKGLMQQLFPVLEDEDRGC